MKIKYLNNTCKCELLNQVSELDGIATAIEKLAVEWKLSVKFANQLNLVVEELFTNIVKYAFNDENKHAILVEFYKEDSYIEIKVIDDGEPFNMTEVKAKPDIEAAVDERKVGGLGIHIVTTIMDDIVYERGNNKNILILTKKY